MTKRHIARVHGYTINELEHFLLHACSIFDGDVSLDQHMLGGWSNINIRGQSNELDFVLKLPSTVSPYDINQYSHLFENSLYFSKLGITARPLAKGQLFDASGMPFIIFEYIDGTIHDSLTDFSDHEISTLKDCLEIVSLQKPPGIKQYKSASNHVTNVYARVETHVGLHDASQEVAALVDLFEKMYPEVVSFTDTLEPWSLSLMHGDLWIPNIIFHSRQVTLLDFEDCAHGNHLYDLAFLLETQVSSSEKKISGIVRSDELDEVNDLRVVALSYIINWSLERLLSMESGLVEQNLSTEESRSAVIGYTRSKITRLRELLP